MTRAEAMELLKLYRNWNTCQRSITCNAEEDRLLDARRVMLRRATELLTSDVEDDGQDRPQGQIYR